MSIPNLIPHKTLYISGYIYSYYAFVFIFEFPEHISKHILQFHAFQLNNALHGTEDSVIYFLCFLQFVILYPLFASSLHLDVMQH